MKSRRTALLLVLFIIVAGLAAFRWSSPPPHPDSLEALRDGHEDYRPLVLDGTPQPGMVTHRMLNGLLIHLKQTPDGYEPVLGVYTNAEGAKVHVQDFDGLVGVHTHALVPDYDLGTAELGGIQARVRQLSPEHYAQGPSRFLLRFARPCQECEVYGRVEHEGNVLAQERMAMVLNPRSRGLVFEPAMSSYPRGSELRIRFALNDTVTELGFPLHELPPPETLSRTLFTDKEDAVLK